MPAYYAASASHFLKHDDDFIIGKLTSIISQGFSELSVEQLDAWRLQLPILKRALQKQTDHDRYLLLEYPIPRRGKRIDAIILAGSLILVIEFKCGARGYESGARAQVEDYCLDLRDFHSASRDRLLIPMLVATGAVAVRWPNSSTSDFVSPVWLMNADSLPDAIDECVRRYALAGEPPIDALQWNEAEYNPTPTIIEAARTLYDGKMRRRECTVSRNAN